MSYYSSSLIFTETFFWHLEHCDCFLLLIFSEVQFMGFPLGGLVQIAVCVFSCAVSKIDAFTLEATTKSLPNGFTWIAEGTHPYSCNPLSGSLFLGQLIHSFLYFILLLFSVIARGRVLLSVPVMDCQHIKLLFCNHKNCCNENATCFCSFNMWCIWKRSFAFSLFHTKHFRMCFKCLSVRNPTLKPSP